MKRENIFKWCRLAALAVLLAAAGVVFWAVWRLDMLPGGYLALLAAVLVLFLAGIAALLLLPGKEKKNPGKVRIAVAAVLSIVLLAGCVMGTVVASDVRRTVEHITDYEEVGSMVAVYVLQEDPAQALADAAEYTFARTAAYDADRTAQAVAAIEQQLHTTLTLADCDSVLAMIDALYAGRVDAMILNIAYQEILAESDMYGDFASRVRVLHTVDLPDEPEVPQTTPATQPAATTAPVITEHHEIVIKNVRQTPFLVYIGGSDTRNYKLLKQTRNDVNILAAVNPVTKQILLINTPRDYYVPNPAGGGAKDKLTHCGIYGIECSVEAIADLYDVPVDYYAQINFTGFQKLIDAVGGVTVYSGVSFVARDTYIKKGDNKLNGAEALDYVRERMALSGGDVARGNNQMKVIKALVDKLTSAKILARYSEILDSLQGLFKTSITDVELSSLVKMQLEDMASWEVLTYAVDGEGASDKPYSMPGLYAYVKYPDMEMVAHATDLINRILAGEVLTQEDVG